jgi:hypothetical protein
MTSDLVNDGSTTESSSSVKTDLTPVYLDGTVIEWDGNNALILPLLHEFGKWSKRTGKFQSLFAHRAANLPNGKIAVDSVQAAHFLLGSATDNRSFDKPCPPTPARIKEYNDDALALGLTALATLTSVPDDLKASVVVAPHAVSNECSKLLVALTAIFGHADSSETLIDAADGDGLKLLQALRARGANADRKDRALVVAKLANVIRTGVSGELTSITFAAFLKSYKAHKRSVPKDSQSTVEAEVEMISLIATKDPNTREIYDLKTAAAQPADLDAAADVLLSILRGRKRVEEIDEVTNGSGAASLAAELTGSLSGAQAAAARRDAQIAAVANAALSAGGATTLSHAQIAAIAAAVKKAVADPRKTADKDKDKVTIPRGPDNKPLKWVEGMAKCKCGIKGGKHLYKDCPKVQQDKDKDKTATAATAEAGSTTLANEIAALRALLATAPVGPGAAMLIDGAAASNLLVE